MATRFSEAFVQEGDTLHLTAPYARAGGEGALVGAIFGVAVADVASGATGGFMTDGVFNLKKTASQAWTAGQAIFWDDANKRCDNDPTKGPRIGYATLAAASGASLTVGQVAIETVPVGRSYGLASASPAPVSKAGATVTLTAAETLSGVLVADPGASTTYTFPTAALLVAAVPAATVGDMIKLYFVNGADANEVITLAAGSGGAFDANQVASSQVIPQNASKLVHIRLTNVTASSEAYVMYA